MDWTEIRLSFNLRSKCTGPNTLVGLATVAEGVDRSELVARLVPAYVDLLTQLKARSLPSFPRCSRPLVPHAATALLSCRHTICWRRPADPRSHGGSRC